jgi:hypothetical protein
VLKLPEVTAGMGCCREDRVHRVTRDGGGGCGAPLESTGERDGETGGAVCGGW